MRPPVLTDEQKGDIWIGMREKGDEYVNVATIDIEKKRHGPLIQCVFQRAADPSRHYAFDVYQTEYENFFEGEVYEVMPVAYTTYRYKRVRETS